MSFFESNRERVRSDLLKLLQEDEIKPQPCSKNGFCDIDTDSDSDVEELMNKTDNVFKSIKSPNKSKDKSKDKKEDDTSTDTSDDDEEKVAKLKNDIDALDKNLKIIKSKFVDFDLPDEDDEDFINNLISQDIEDESGSGTTNTFIEKKPYKIEIHSSYEPDAEYEEPINVKLPGYCGLEYTDFDAFYEHYINDEKEAKDDKDEQRKQFEIFNDIIVENLVKSDESIQDIMEEFRKKVSQEWTGYITEANVEYNLSLADPKKWVARADTILYDMYQKQSVIDYVHHLANLLVLFNSNQTFGLDEHMYVDVGNKALEPIDMKKYKLEDLMEYYTKGKNVSRILVQDVTDNIKIKQNIKSINLLILLYNKITESEIKLLDVCNDPPELQTRVKEQLLQQHQQHLVLNRPIIYVDPKTKKIYIFDYRKLNEKFVEGDKINPYTNETFCEEFVELCSQKMKNHMLCVFCKDKISEDQQLLKTIYLHPKYGPILLKFCGATCFTDLNWNNKSLQNAIIGIV